MKRDSITIVLVPDNRKPLTIELTIKELVLAALLLLILLSAATYSIIAYNRLESRHEQLKSSVITIEENISEREARISELREKLSSKDDLVVLVGEGRDTSEVFPGYKSNDILIGNLEVQAEEEGLCVTFDLINNTPDDRLLTGYLLLIVEHRSSEIDRFGTFPEFRLEHGVPLDYRVGNTYAIKRFKTVQAEVTLIEEPENYSKVRFLVFDEEGGVLLYDTNILDW
ncbi:MAG: hypothetical protein U9N45_07935 [Gemmatimonadota bacterium]|nr:hypothetical protein [Gemmatimonadota bacterium]